MLFFILGVVIALLAGYIVINLIGLAFSLIIRIISWIFGS